MDDLYLIGICQKWQFQTSYNAAFFVNIDVYVFNMIKYKNANIFSVGLPNKIAVIVLHNGRKLIKMYHQ